MIFNLSCAIIQILLWWIYDYNILQNKFGKTVNNLSKDLIDVFPCILIIKYHNPIGLFFLLGCMISDKFIFDYLPIGVLMFLFTYGGVSLYTIQNYEFNYIYYLISLLIILINIIFIFKFWKTNKIEKIGAIIYELTSLNLLIVAFMYTHNLGFIFLVIGDLLLIIKEINKKKYNTLILAISNSFYFLGLSLVPLCF